MYCKVRFLPPPPYNPEISKRSITSKVSLFLLFEEVSPVGLLVEPFLGLILSLSNLSFLSLLLLLAKVDRLELSVDATSFCLLLVSLYLIQKIC